MYSLLIIAVLLAVLLWVTVDSLSKIFIKRLGRQRSIVSIVAIGIIPAIIAVVIIGLPSMNVYGFIELLAASAAAGVALFAGFVAVYKSIGKAGIANSYILVELQPPILIIFGLLALSEHLNSIQLASIALIFIGIIFVTTTKGLKLNRKLLPSVIGNVFWALYWIAAVTAMTYLKEYALLLLFIRIFAALFALVYYIISRPPSLYHGELLNRTKNIVPAYLIMLIVIAGLADGTANILFSFVSFNHKLAVASAILTMEPIIVWLIGIKFYKEKVSHFQKIGFIIATAGYILLSIA